MKRRMRVHALLGAAVLAVSCVAAAQDASPFADARRTGTDFLSPGLRALQEDRTSGPISMWLERGRMLWNTPGPAGATGKSCMSCHGQPESLADTVPHYPRMEAGSERVLSLDDQLLRCAARVGRPRAQMDDEDQLSLSALLRDAARGRPLEPQPPPPAAARAWQERLTHGAELFAQRRGRMNLACTHCHDQNVGKQIRTDTISPAHPTGFPVYRMTWQMLGSMERRIRACYSGLQAVMPPPGHTDLRDLELFLSVRAQGMTLEGPSVRR